jgi:hypothetical protein
MSLSNYRNTKRLDLTRRGTGSTPTSTGWFNELYDVTQIVLNTRKVTLTQIPVLGSDLVMLNGLPLFNDINWDYIISGNEIQFQNDLELTNGDTVRIKYQA